MNRAGTHRTQRHALSQVEQGAVSAESAARGRAVSAVDGTVKANTEEGVGSGWAVGDTGGVNEEVACAALLALGGVANVAGLAVGDVAGDGVVVVALVGAGEGVVGCALCTNRRGVAGSASNRTGCAGKSSTVGVCSHRTDSLTQPVEHVVPRTARHA